MKIDKSRLARECDKLDPVEERELSEEGIGIEAKEWEKYEIEGLGEIIGG